jgi:hypothetical protein
MEAQDCLRTICGAKHHHALLRQSLTINIGDHRHMHGMSAVNAGTAEHIPSMGVGTRKVVEPGFAIRQSYPPQFG